ncbi:MAG TPA: carboxypeptidase-like regulatory domain-containing protein [Polyangiaceae bacterium]|nr:carboxypeptidase-like regulatory domain-containing protein [Polyangiaceae bacterium]
MTGHRWLAVALLVCTGVAAALWWKGSTTGAASRFVARHSSSPRSRGSSGSDESVAETAARSAVRAAHGAITGRVVDAGGRPVPGARLRVYASEGAAELGSATTDTAGAFEIGGLAPGAFRVVVRSPEHRTVSLTSALHRQGERRRIVVALEPGRTLRGRVLSPERTPVPGARVGVSDGLVGIATTDAAGEFELRGLGKDPVNVYAVVPGYAPARVQGRLPGTTRLELVLEPPARIEGTLVAPADAERVMVSVCRAFVSDGEAPCVARRLFPAGATRYELERLSSGDYELLAEAEGHPELRVPVRVGPGERVVGPALSFR